VPETHLGAFTIGSQLLDGHSAAKSRQPSHELPCERTGTRHTELNSVKKGRDRGGETASKESPHSGKTLTLRKALTKMPTKPLQCPMDQEHEESWRIRTSTRPLTAQVKLVFLVVQSVELHSTALN